MRLHGAVVREQGKIFAIIIVKRHVVNSKFRANETIEAFQNEFPNLPIILMAQDHRGMPTYYGRHDIVNILKNVPVECIPWKVYYLREC